jgi:hypothetical protein
MRRAKLAFALKTPALLQAYPPIKRPGFRPNRTLHGRTAHFFHQEDMN